MWMLVKVGGSSCIYDLYHNINTLDTEKAQSCLATIASISLNCSILRPDEPFFFLSATGPLAIQLPPIILKTHISHA